MPKAPSTLPADFNFAQGASAPDTLPANFKFAEQQKTTSSTATEQPGLMSRIDSAVTDALTPNPQNYESATRTNAVEVPKTLGREVYGAGKTILGMIPGVYHAVADPLTEQEQEEFRGHDRIPGEVAVERLTGAPLVRAAEDYANPKTRPSVNDALSVAPEALGNAAGNVIAAKGVEVGLPKITGAVGDISDAVNRNAGTIKRVATAPARVAARTALAAGRLPKIVPQTLDSLSRVGLPEETAPASPLGSAVQRTPDTSMRQLGAKAQDLIQESLGGKTLRRNVPLRDQANAPATDPEHLGQFARSNGTALDSAIPETTEGNVLRSKLHNLTNIELRQLAINAGEDLGQLKIGRGKLTDNIPRTQVFSRLLRNHSPEELGEMVDNNQHTADAGSVQTNIEPEKLLDRWGVNAKSLADTDEQTRGMSPRKSADYINKLAEAYKAGKKIEPVIETRDAQNNITEVDGRHRALAAQKAGVSRIPVIVKRAAPRPLSPLNSRVVKSLGLSSKAVDWLKNSGMNDAAVSKTLARLTRSQLNDLAAA